MPLSSNVLWTDDRVEQTVNESYIRSKLRPKEEAVLKQKVFFGGEGALTDDTYLDWILSRAKRLFLILATLDIPEQIFGLIDDSYDDEDLPIQEDGVPALRLSKQSNADLDRRFYKAQFTFLTRIVGEGEHIRYSPEEILPVNVLGIRAVVSSGPNDRFDRVRLPLLPNKVLIRRVFQPRERTESEVMSEIAAARLFAHDHIISVFGSYSQSQITSVLSVPAPDLTLKVFLSDTPKSFDALPKLGRRRVLLGWPHCLACALAWLHRSTTHGAIRPSRIQVDQFFNITLGFLEGDGVLCSPSMQDDVEAYQYSAPEKWKRAVTLQNTASGKTALPSGGRRGRRLTQSSQPIANNDYQVASSTEASATDTSPSYAFIPTSKNASRLRLGLSNTGIAPMDASQLRTARPVEGPYTSSRSATTDKTSNSQMASLVSSSSSRSTQLLRTTHTKSIIVAGPEVRTAAVQTWQSVEGVSDAADVFSLAAVIFDILTMLCKRSYSSFAKHRSAKNRNAGRGGGIADASFHANLGQLASWAEQLQKDAQKKSKSDDGLVFAAVGPISRLLLQAVEKEPYNRPSSFKLANEISRCLSDHAKFDQLHCKSIGGDISKEPAKMGSVRSRPPEKEKEQLSSSATPRDGVATLEESLAEVDLQHTQTGGSGLSEFSFDFPGAPRYTTSKSRQQSTKNQDGVDDWDESAYVDQFTQPDMVDMHHAQAANQDNDDDEDLVDPRLSRASDKGAFTYMNYSTGESSEDEGQPITSPRSPPPLPPSQAPTRDLPAIPSRVAGKSPRMGTGPMTRSKAHAVKTEAQKLACRAGAGKDNKETRR